MLKLVIASTRKSAGKTGIILGMASALKKKAGYIKPLGDRLLYRKKRLWDYDAAVVIHALGSDTPAEDVTIGFERSKLKYMYDEDQVKAKLAELAAHNASGREILFVEAGSDLAHGTSVHLDPVSVARSLDAGLVIVAQGPDDTAVDDLTYVRKYVNLDGVDLRGVIINKISDPDDFGFSHMAEVRSLGMKVLGVLPHRPELPRFSVRFLAECLFARIVTGEDNLDNRVRHVFVGAMSGDAALKEAAFQKEGKLIITSGDRSDMILAALRTNTVGIVLANNVLPPANIVSKAAEKKVPLLLVSADTFLAAKQVDDLEPLITMQDTDKVELLAQLVADQLDLAALGQ